MNGMKGLFLSITVASLSGCATYGAGAYYEGGSGYYNSPYYGYYAPYGPYYNSPVFVEPRFDFRFHQSHRHGPRLSHGDRMHGPRSMGQSLARDGHFRQR